MLFKQKKLQKPQKLEPIPGLLAI